MSKITIDISGLSITDLKRLKKLTNDKENLASIENELIIRKAFKRNNDIVKKEPNAKEKLEIVRLRDEVGMTYPDISFKLHKSVVSIRDTYMKTKTRMAQQKTYPDFFLLKDFIYFSANETRAFNALKRAGLLDNNIWVNVTEENLLKIRGIGEENCDFILETQKAYKDKYGLE